MCFECQFLCISGSGLSLLRIALPMQLVDSQGSVVGRCTETTKYSDASDVEKEKKRKREKEKERKMRRKLSERERRERERKEMSNCREIEKKC